MQFLRRFLMIVLGLSLIPSACAPVPTPTAPPATATSSVPEWFQTEMTDVRTGKTFTINDFSGKVVLIETMAQWCPTCWEQQNEIKKLPDLLGKDASDLIYVSLDVDINEDAVSLKAYVAKLGYDWYIAVAPRDVARTLSTLYGAEYLNPPLAPMLIIDRQQSVYGLPYGLKAAILLKNTLKQYLTP
jgi:hypothetical protein